ncbi:class I SAM-dependent DNA methyltransferase [Hansschlegelia sp. KR7-227]|uniref:class I SAM-dependent DNA methyltransferase n=1 Tax=Hansschlegelia sp. KR7-227 TaxID=3400914 RepID=UPI003BFE5D8D
MRRSGSLPPGYFEDMYRADPDPWRFESSAYEAEKYDRTIAALGGRRYATALEIGCANGVLTRRLADHALDLLAIDVSETALARARTRCRDGGVRFERRMFPSDVPEGPFDLIVLSEVAYYLDDADLATAARWLDGALRAHGDLLMVHWTGETDYPQSGDEAVAKLTAGIEAPLHRLTGERTESYRLDLWRRTP